MIIKEKKGFPKAISDKEGHELIVGGSGSGKTTGVERLTQDYREKYNSTIINIGNNKNNVESGFGIFPVEANWQKKALKKQKETVIQQEIIFYHPYTSNFPKNRLYPYEIFTIDIRALDRSVTSFIFESSSETSSLATLNNQIEILDKEDSYFDLMKNVKENSNSITYNTIEKFISKIKYSPIFFPSNSRYNLNFEKILNDNSHAHTFDNRFLPDDKMKALTILVILQSIKKAKESGRVKNHIVVVLDELKSLVPRNPQFAYQSILAKTLADLISTLRSLGVSFVTATQQYGGIDTSVAQSFNNVVLMRTTAFPEIKELSSILSLSSEVRRAIVGLDRGQFIILSNLLNYGDVEIFEFHAPNFAHNEAGLHFDRECKKHFPEKLVSHKKILDEIKKDWDIQKLKTKMKEEAGI